MIYNYHTHTERCGHAHGGDEEFINRAIEAGIKYLGFSDHMPMIFPDGYESSYRVPMSEAESYVSDLRKLREKHRDKIRAYREKPKQSLAYKSTEYSRAFSYKAERDKRRRRKEDYRHGSLKARDLYRLFFFRLSVFCFVFHGDLALL